MEIYKSLIAFQKELPKVNLDGVVNYKGVKFKYATLSNLVDSVMPSLNQHNLGFIQTIESGEIITTLFSEKGETIKSSYPLPNISNPQDLGKWMTYIKRYQLCSILGIVAEDDNDGQLQKPNASVAEAIALKLKSVKDIKELTVLYNNNQDLVKKDFKIQKLFKEKKESLGTAV